MIESTGTSGRLPVLSCHMKLAQSTVQVTRNTWPGVAGVLPLKPPTAAYPTAGLSAVFMLLGSKATSRMGRFGSALLPSVTFVQIDWLEPVPMLRPIWTLPSFVPTIASDHVAGEYASWLMYERLPRVAFVRFAGLLAYQLALVPLYELTVSHTRIVPAIMWLHVGVPVVTQSVSGRPPGLPGFPLKTSYGRMNDCWSECIPELLKTENDEPLLVQFAAVQRLIRPLLLPWNMRLLSGSMRP